MTEEMNMLDPSDITQDDRAVLEQERIERGECPKCGIELAVERQVFGRNHDNRFCEFTWADLMRFMKEIRNGDNSITRTD